ncbi:MAG: hypothetical protein M3237_10515 [Actinomycetota bacterium]|nr:hypothetical protein [Actinomycetota bacterium]
MVSRAGANALTLGIADSPISTGIVAATNDGLGEVKTGEVTPPIAVLGNQNLLDVGALIQDATAAVEGRDGMSEACAGVAGNGGQVATVGESSCIAPGDPVGISIANLDLTGSVLIDPESALGQLAALQPIMDELVGPLTQAISDGLEPLGATGLGGTLGAVESRCTAIPGSAEGSANIVDTQLTLSIAGTDVPLVNFPANPPPNTKVLTNLDVVLNTVLDALRTDINTTLDGALAPLSAVIDPIQDQIVNVLIAEIAPQLAPLEENILDITLNKQTTPTAGAIAVTAIDLKLLPAAAQFGSPPLVTAEIATVTCGPNGRTDAPDGPDGPDAPGGPGGPDGPDNPDLPDVPTTVDSGVGGGNGPSPWTLVGLAGMTAAGAFGMRRLLPRA